MNTDSKAVKVTRRDFLKTAGVTAGLTGAVAALGTGVAGGGRSPLVTKASAAAKAQQSEWHWAFCRMCQRGDCPAQYNLVNGVVMEVKGNPAGVNNQGGMCPRGLSMIQNLYNPYRVKAPLKRTNPKKGLDQDPGWVEISWDEALDTVARKLKAVHDKDPRGLVVNMGFGNMDYFTQFIPYIPASFGTPNLVASNGPLCTVHYATELLQASFPTAISDFSLCEYHINLGRSIGGNIGAADGEARVFVDAIARGMKMVNVDPRNSQEGSKAEWVPILPGSDVAFALAMIHTMLYEIKAIDTDFLTNRTNGPYLIGPDGGYWRNAAGKPQVFDAKSKRPMPFDAPGVTPELEGEFDTPAGKRKTGFTILKESMAPYTAQWAAPITTIPAATIRRLAQDFVSHAHIGETITFNGVVFPFRPVSIQPSRGSINHQDGTLLDLSCKIINELVGNMDVPGGCLGCRKGPVLEPDEDGTVKPFFEAKGEPFRYPPQTVELVEYFPFRHALPHLAFEVMNQPEKYGLPYHPEMLLCIAGNSIIGLVEPEKMARLVAGIPYVVNIAYNYDEMVRMSDVVMPEHAVLERLSVNVYESSFRAIGPDTRGKRMVMFRDPVKPIYNTRQAQDIIFELWARIGLLPKLFGAMNHIGVFMGEITKSSLPEAAQLDPAQSYTVAEIFDRGLRVLAGPDKGVEWFRANGIWTEQLPPELCYNFFHFPMGKTRYQIYFEGLRSGGQKLRENLAKNHVKIPGFDIDQQLSYYDAVPRWRRTALLEAPKEFDLRAFNFKLTLANFRMGGLDQLPWLMEVGDKLDPIYDRVCMNPLTAQARGLKDGQMVCVESQYGKTTGRLKVSELFHPGAVGIGGAMGRMVSTLGKAPAARIHYNRLLGAPLNAIDPVSGGVEGTVRVKVYAA